MQWLEYSGIKLGLDSQLVRRLELVTEELFLNTLQHGYGAPCDELITVSLETSPEQVCLIYTDQAPAFNPLQEMPSLTAQEPTGVGLALIRQIPNHANYQRLATGNQILLYFHPASPGH